VTFLSTVTDQFSYFAAQLGEWGWRGRDVLDFGGNVGNILRDPHSTIERGRYWCLDVDEESIERGKELYPDAHWIFYDRYSFFFNPRGVPRLPIPDMGRKFDYIVAYSVFTNTTRDEMLELVGQLESSLTDGGALAFTFLDPFHYSAQEHYKKSNLHWRLELEWKKGAVSVREMQTLAARAHQADWFALVNGRDLYTEADDVRAYGPERESSFVVFHTEEYMKKLFPRAEVRAPVNGAMQHCCVIRKR
jgi:SAM-dependent methyltransferase